MSARKVRTGFTLVELLVVITIIGMLVALLLPAVTAARENGRRAQCMNNMKQIALATLSFESSKQRFPGWREHIGVDTQGRQVKSGWMFVMLPQLDRPDLYRQYTSKNQAEGGLMGVLPHEALPFGLCPSNPQESQATAPISYVVNAGAPDRVITSERLALQQSGDAAANGIFHDVDPFISPTSPAGPTGQPMAPKKIVKFNSNSIQDGSATTMMLSERVEARNWTDYGAPAWENGSQQQYLGEMYTGFCWYPAPQDQLPSPSSDYSFNGIKPAFEVTDGNLNYHDVRPSSSHQGGVFAAFADGHVQFVSDDIPYAVYQQLMAPNGLRAEAVQQNAPFPLRIPLDTAQYSSNQ